MEENEAKSGRKGKIEGLPTEMDTGRWWAVKSLATRIVEEGKRVSNDI